MNDHEIEIVRARLREYQDLLETCYHFIKANFQRSNSVPFQRLIEQLEQHGVGERQQKPIFDRRDIGE